MPSLRPAVTKTPQIYVTIHPTWRRFPRRFRSWTPQAIAIFIFTQFEVLDPPGHSSDEYNASAGRHPFNEGARQLDLGDSADELGLGLMLARFSRGRCSVIPRLHPQKKAFDVSKIDSFSIATDRWGGLLRAVFILVSWTILLSTGLFFIQVSLDSIIWILLLIFSIAFCYTGLFITAHDAMHRTLMPAHPKMNDAIGKLCVRLFALFSYTKLLTKHHQHHHSPASDKDPDYHDGKHPSFIAWYIHFMREYVTLGQILGMGTVFILLWRFAGARPENIILFWAIPSLLSTTQLFYFGTYLPHRQPADGYNNPHRAQSNNYPVWLSFLTCYHFGYHLEHHEYPFVPWWKLARLRAELKKSSTLPPR